MIYAIETLKIEKYKLIALRRQGNSEDTFDDICDKLKQLDWAIAELEKEQPK